MSIHRSLVTQGKLTRHRNVLNRTERLQLLIAEDRWDLAKKGPLGLPKVRSIKHKAKKAKKTEEAAAPAAGAAAPAAGAKAAPAAKGAAPAKGAAAPAAKAPAKKG